jgi:DNA-binding transcriptional MerR regulator
MLTISELASYAGVTVRAVRHYHAKGLLPEPERDASGYRRYDAQAVVELIRIRTLADAGVPLARVRELLAADDDEFAAAVTEIDARLRAEIRERQHHREQIARLAAGDSLALPPETVDYLRKLRELGLPERVVDLERDAWILLAAHSPERMPEIMAEKHKQIEDPELIDLYRSLFEASEWDADDARLPPLADRLAAYIDREMAAHDYSNVEDLADDGVVELIDSVFFDAVPAARRLVQLLEERGWSGWTQMKPVNT